MLNDTPQKKVNNQTTEKKPKSTYDGGFHIKATPKRRKDSANKRSSVQSFKFG